jgi:Raf kinase inhibitor-like YbhB/YbcL family protein
MGKEKLVVIMVLTISSDAFKNDDYIPKRYAGDGNNINPPLTIEGIPTGTKTLALIVDDTDAPMGTFTHWVMWNIPPVETIAENSVPGVQGRNSGRRNSYTGPYPPYGTHHYVFKIHALDSDLDLDPNASKQDLEKAMESHILAKAELAGLYKRG